MKNFLEALRVQRWDDHRYYHHSRMNQTLHLVSALSFLCAYALLFIDPAMAALVGWLVAMTSRQIGHIVFEPKGYDHVNKATHQYKEAIKVGYNLRRKAVLLTAWVLSPLLLVLDPHLFGLVESHTNALEFVRNVGILWLVLGATGLAFRTVHLFFIKDITTGLVWCSKILTDPFHDIKLYYKAPLHLLRGEWYDPMRHAKNG
jgi:hypothetical protein